MPTGSSFLSRSRIENNGRPARKVGPILAIAIAVLVTGFGGASAVASTGGKLHAHTATSSVAIRARQAYPAVRKLLAGIPQRGEMLGQASAKVTVLYFGDLECPYCRQFDRTVLPKFIAQFVRAGKVKVQYVSLETATFSESLFETQQAAAYAAGRQDRFWQYAELFERLQGSEETDYVNAEFLDGLASAIPGLSFQRWTSQRVASDYKRQFAREGALANRYGVDSTPSIVMIGPKGHEVVNGADGGTPAERDLAAAVAKLS